MRVAVTGASGFIGTHLVKFLIANGHEVLALDIHWPGEHPLSAMLFGPGHHQVRIDISKELVRLNQMFANFKPDVCYHLAAYASEGRSSWIRSFIQMNNTVGAANVINACVNNNVKLVFTSSVAVYGTMKGKYSEMHLPDPIDEYGISKYCTEMSIKVAAELQDLKYCIIRPRNVMGEYQNLFDRSRNLFGIWCYNALNKLPLQIYGTGNQTRCFTYVGDIIEPLFNAHEEHGYTINLGSSKPYTINEAAEIFTRVSGYRLIQHIQGRHEALEATCETGLSERVLGYQDKTSLEEAITMMWNWAKDQPMRALDQMPPLEVIMNTHESLK